MIYNPPHFTHEAASICVKLEESTKIYFLFVSVGLVVELNELVRLRVFYLFPNSSPSNLHKVEDSCL